MADAFVIETADLRKTYDGAEALHLLLPDRVDAHVAHLGAELRETPGGVRDAHLVSGGGCRRAGGPRRRLDGTRTAEPRLL